jgi:hypothetical protein
MQKWILTAFSAMALVNIALAGCAPAVHPNGFIDKSGTLIVDFSKFKPKPLAIGDYSEELAPIKLATGIEWLDKTGKIAFEKPFRNVATFSDGKAAFSVGKSDSDERWGYINTKGDIVVKPIYTTANKFSEGAAAVRLAPDTKYGKNAGRWCYIDDTGKQIIDQTFDKAEPFTEGLASVTLNGRMGCITRSGHFVVPPMYDVVYAANEGLIVAAQGNGLSGPSSAQQLDYFDKAGTKQGHKEMKPVTLQNLRPMLWVKSDSTNNSGDPNLNRPLSPFATPGYCEGKSISQSGPKFCIDQVFNARAFAGAYDYIFPVTNGFFVVYDDGDGGKMDYRGGIPEDASGIWNSKTFRFWDAAPFSEGLGLVQESKGGRYGYIDKTGNFALKPIYDHARPFKDGRALVGESALHNF